IVLGARLAALLVAVTVAVPAPALELEGAVRDQPLELRLLALRAVGEPGLRDALRGLELVAAVLALVLVDRHRVLPPEAVVKLIIPRTMSSTTRSRVLIIRLIPMITQCFFRTRSPV